ncbi:hypothetical protein E2C01_083742 [Portunus trituberculatus]|uniref:Uncharacterized protein n=1 Tax=Portunus trituberculatus TaxID=210409 RepID=A0A5B7IT90_PORTR|nr:hypothetical protein [Portunus trituberculatus]
MARRKADEERDPKENVVIIEFAKDANYDYPTCPQQLCDSPEAALLLFCPARVRRHVFFVVTRAFDFLTHSTPLSPLTSRN